MSEAGLKEQVITFMSSFSGLPGICLPASKSLNIPANVCSSASLEDILWILVCRLIKTACERFHDCFSASSTPSKYVLGLFLPENTRASEYVSLSARLKKFKDANKCLFLLPPWRTFSGYLSVGS